MLPLSISILAHNEASELARALESLKGWDVEIVIVVADSQDETEVVARKYTNSVHLRPNNLQLNINKVEGFNQCTREWIFYLDADEVMTPELRKEVESVLQNTNIDGYWMPRKTYWFGDRWLRHGGLYPDLQLRLFRRKKGSFACKNVHEYLDVQGSLGHLREPFLHYTRVLTINDYLVKNIMFYSDRERDVILAENRNPWTYILWKPFYYGFAYYIYRLGILDGFLGLFWGVSTGYFYFLSGIKALIARSQKG